VTGIVDMDGELVVQYAYDAWGKPVIVKGSLAGTLGADNPFRYRGYVWDEETGLYYLRSRYYDPVWGRWLNADTLLGQAGALLSHNGFAYCLNNPVMRVDPSGMASVAVAIGLKELLWGLGTLLVAVAVQAWSKAQPAPAPRYNNPPPGTPAPNLPPNNISTFPPFPYKIPDSFPLPAPAATPAPTSSGTPIYRGGGFTLMNLTPRPGIDTRGLSFYLSAPGGQYVTTTVEAVNATGVLEAVIDGYNHASVRPRNITELSEWALSRPDANENPHPYSVLLYSISWRGN
jgi:RHS repeat-associated protein